MEIKYYVRGDSLRKTAVFEKKTMQKRYSTEENTRKGLIFY